MRCKALVSRRISHVWLKACWILLAGGLAAAGCQRETIVPDDKTFPEQVTDLIVAEVTDTTVTLVWTAPGDDGRAGTVARYDIRHLGAPLGDQDWDSAVPVPAPAPEPGGTLQSLVIHDLPYGERRWFGLRSADEVPNWSVLSNIVSAVAGPPACYVEPPALAFGRVAVNGAYDLSCEVVNLGGGTLEGTVPAGCGPFTVVTGDGPFRLRTSQHLTLTVRFSPVEEGPISCELDLGSDCAAIMLSGEGGAVEARLIPILVGSGTTFTMGSQASEPGRDDDETPHPVTLTRSFLVSDHEVTQGEWREIMGWGDARFPGADRPVESVTWYDAIEFCNRFSLAEGLDPAYDIGNKDLEGNHIIAADVIWNTDRNGYRLPTEAEWEFVCRAGTLTPFWSGELTELGCLPPDPNLDEAGWYCGNAGGSTQPVQGKGANPWELYDTHGNVHEWVWDWYDSFYGRDPETPPEDPSVDPSGPLEGLGRVARGGAWSVTARASRSAFRLFHLPGRAYDDVGFRVVRNAP